MRKLVDEQAYEKAYAELKKKMAGIHCCVCGKKLPEYNDDFCSADCFIKLVNSVPRTSSVYRILAFERDKNTCVKCGKYSPTGSGLIADHIEPIILGGDEFDLDNIQTLCVRCDRVKTKKEQKIINKYLSKKELE